MLAAKSINHIRINKPNRTIEHVNIIKDLTPILLAARSISAITYEPVYCDPDVLSDVYCALQKISQQAEVRLKQHVIALQIYLHQNYHSRILFESVLLQFIHLFAVTYTTHAKLLTYKYMDCLLMGPTYSVLHRLEQLDNVKEDFMHLLHYALNTFTYIGRNVKTPFEMYKLAANLIK